MTVQARGGGGAPGPYSAGQAIVIGIEFSAPVAVRASAAGAAPYLELRTGSAGALAAYDGGNNTRTLVFVYTMRGGDLTERLLYADASALILSGSSIAAVGTGEAASAVLPDPGAPGSLSDPGGPAVRIGPEPGRPVPGIGILDDENGGGGGATASRAALAAACEFNGRQGLAESALLVNATVYDAGAPAASAASVAGAAAAEALRAAHSSGAGPSVYVGPSTDRGCTRQCRTHWTTESCWSAPARRPRPWPSRAIRCSACCRAPALTPRRSRALRSAEGQSPCTQSSRTPRTAFDPCRPDPGGRDASFPRQVLARIRRGLAYAGVPVLSGTVSLAGAAGSYGAAEAAEALDASVRSGPAPAAVVYMGSPDGLAALAGASAGFLRPAVRQRVRTGRRRLDIAAAAAAVARAAGLGCGVARVAEVHPTRRAVRAPTGSQSTPLTRPQPTGPSPAHAPFAVWARPCPAS